MGTVKGQIEQRLRDQLQPLHLAVRDDSHLHVGHAGHRPGGETHFAVEIVSERFAGESRVGRQRLVYAAVGELMREHIHALTISARAPTDPA